MLSAISVRTVAPACPVRPGHASMLSLGRGAVPSSAAAAPGIPAMCAKVANQSAACMYPVYFVPRTLSGTTPPVTNAAVLTPPWKAEPFPPRLVYSTDDTHRVSTFLLQQHMLGRSCITAAKAHGGVQRIVVSRTGRSLGAGVAHPSRAPIVRRPHYQRVLPQPRPFQRSCYVSHRLVHRRDHRAEHHPRLALHRRRIPVPQRISVLIECLQE